MSNPSSPAPALSPIERLLGIMARLRDPDGGCPWDVEQTFATIAPHTIEEAYEVADAIDHGDMAHLQDELGDLLFQVVFYAQMASEQDDFDFNDVVTGIADKMIRRHPHVFADVDIKSANQQTEHWETIKARERKEKTQDQDGGALDHVSRALPALLRAYKLQKRAARVGFDWPDAEPVFAKFEEELDEIHQEIKTGDQAALQNEVGDLLFTCVNLARKLGVDPETSLRHANGRFEERFQGIEAELAKSGRTPQDADLDELEDLWQRVKDAINSASPT